jgi:zinc transport system substrate-binding protein
MKMSVWLIRFFLVCSLLSLPACQTSSYIAEGQNVLTVSIAPQQYFVERIAGNLFTVNVMVLPGQSPENYEPSPQQMGKISQSMAYIAIGAPFETVWLKKLQSANPQMIIFDSTSGIERQPIAMHSHGDESIITGELDPHVWTSPRLVKIQARNIADLLINLDPENKPVIEQNLQTFLDDINILDGQIKEELAPATNRKFLVYHPTWGYFASDYNLEQLVIEAEGTEPSAREMANIIDEAKAEQVKVIFIQPEFNSRSAETIAAEIGADVIPISSLEKDWLENLRSVGKKLADSLIQ